MGSWQDCEWADREQELGLGPSTVLDPNTIPGQPVPVWGCLDLCHLFTK